jgi:hypothetical protein
MRHLPKMTDDYGIDLDRGLQASLHDRDIEQIVEAYGDDWSLDGEDDLDISN